MIIGKVVKVIQKSCLDLVLKKKWVESLGVKVGIEFIFLKIKTIEAERTRKNCLDFS